MGKVDSAAKEYFSNNKRFADLCNYVLFDGEEVILPDSLKEKDTTEVLSVFGADKKQAYFQKWRDLLKSAVIKSCNNVYIMIVGAEAQANVHYAMPVKNMIYDSLNYGDQVRKIARKHKEENDTSTEDEFLSGFTAEDKLIPVITITVYLGDKDWDGPRKLSDMYTDVDERLKPFLTEFNANVLVPKEIKNFDKFHTDLKQIFEVLKAAGDKEEMAAFLKKDEQFKNLDNETVRAINDIAHAKIPVNEKGKVTDMFKAWNDQYLDGKNEGLAEGRRAGKGEAFYTLVQDGKLSVETGAEYAGVSVPEFEKAMTAAGYKIPAEV